MVSLHIWLTSILLAAVACGRTEITGGGATQPAQPQPQAQTPPDSTKTSGKTGQKPAVDKQAKPAPDTSNTLGSIQAGGQSSDDATPATDTGAGGGSGAGNQPPPSPQPPAVTTSTSTSESSDPNVVVFRIKPGTGNGAWNTPDNPIVARVGQTLEIRNEDSVQHWVHAGFNDFTFHALSGIDPGQSSRIKINNNRAAGVHDHNTGGAIHFNISN